MAGSWQPQEDGLRHVLKMLKEYQSLDNATGIAAVKQVCSPLSPKNFLKKTLEVHASCDPILQYSTVSCQSFDI